MRWRPSWAAVRGSRAFSREKEQKLLESGARKTLRTTVPVCVCVEEGVEWERVKLVKVGYIKAEWGREGVFRLVLLFCNSYFGS